MSFSALTVAILFSAKAHAMSDISSQTIYEFIPGAANVVRDFSDMIEVEKVGVVECYPVIPATDSMPFKCYISNNGREYGIATVIENPNFTKPIFDDVLAENHGVGMATSVETYLGPVKVKLVCRKKIEVNRRQIGIGAKSVSQECHRL